LVVDYLLRRLIARPGLEFAPRARLGGIFSGRSCFITPPINPQNSPRKREREWKKLQRAPAKATFLGYLWEKLRAIQQGCEHLIHAAHGEVTRQTKSDALKPPFRPRPQSIRELKQATAGKKLPWIGDIDVYGDARFSAVHGVTSGSAA
jgi:hypothetical protein